MDARPSLNIELKYQEQSRKKTYFWKSIPLTRQWMLWLQVTGLSFQTITTIWPHPKGPVSAYSLHTGVPLPPFPSLLAQVTIFF